MKTENQLPENHCPDETTALRTAAAARSASEDYSGWPGGGPGVFIGVLKVIPPQRPTRKLRFS